MTLINAYGVMLPESRIRFLDVVYEFAVASKHIPPLDKDGRDGLRNFVSKKARRRIELHYLNGEYETRSKVLKKGAKRTQIERGFRTAARKLIGKLILPELSGRIELHKREALPLNDENVHLLSSQFFALVGTGCVMVRDSGDGQTPGIVTFDAQAIARMIDKVRKRAGNASVSERDTRLLEKLVGEIKAFVDKMTPEERPFFPETVWDKWMEPIARWAEEPENLGRPPAWSKNWYMKTMVSAQKKVGLETKKGRKGKARELGLSKVEEHFIKNYQLILESEIGENEDLL